MLMTENDQAAYEILRSIRRILHKVSQHSRALAQEAGLTVPQVLCLKAIDELSHEGETTVGNISQFVRLSPATVSRILDRLERSKYVLRERKSADRRKVTLLLTESGQERLEAIPMPLQEKFLSRLNELEADGRGNIQDALDQLVRMMEAEELPADPLLGEDF